MAYEYWSALVEYAASQVGILCLVLENGDLDPLDGKWVFHGLGGLLMKTIAQLTRQQTVQISRKGLLQVAHAYSVRDNALKPGSRSSGLSLSVASPRNDNFRMPKQTMARRSISNPDDGQRHNGYSGGA